MDKIQRFKYVILPENNLIIEFWKGEFSFEEILDFKHIEASDPDWRDYYDVLADDRFSEKEIRGFDSSEEDPEILARSEKFIKKRKSAILTSLPKQVVSSLMLKQKNTPQSLVEIDIFSTVVAALKWLNVSMKELDRINEILEELSKE